MHETPPFLSDDWLATAVGIAVTYLVFIMGIPALIFQTFIADGLRTIYNERLQKKKWYWFFLIQLGLLTLLFVEGNHYVYLMEKEYRFSAWGISVLIVLIVLVILLGGLNYLHRQFKSTQNIEQQLARTIVNDALVFFDSDKNGDLREKDLEDLSVLAKEVRAGTIKNHYLEECERLLEALLNTEKGRKNIKMIKRVLDRTICLSVNSDGLQVNPENRNKVLELLNLTYHQALAKEMPDGSHLVDQDSYLNTIISNCIREVGQTALAKNDMVAFTNALDKLGFIKSTAREMFVLGNEALRLGHVRQAVEILHRLGSQVRYPFPENADESEAVDAQRNCAYWLGFLSKFYHLQGSAARYARRQLEKVFRQHLSDESAMRQLLQQAGQHFYKLADFASADAVGALEEDLFSSPTTF